MQKVEPPDQLGSVSAVLVPTSRPPVYLRNVLRLAVQINCPVVALCSQDARVDEANKIAKKLGAKLIAVEYKGKSTLPDFASTSLLWTWERKRNLWRRKADTSFKRNIGLALSVMMRWERVLFIDDDMGFLNPDDFRAAATWLSDYDMVMLENCGFPDNSVVYHALRAIGEQPGVFYGGGAMAVAMDRVKSFFPNIFNEDWLFLIGEDTVHRIAVTGKVDQDCFDPFLTPDRARGEEFGDCIAEGLFALFDEGRSLQDAGMHYWREFLIKRHEVIESVLERLPDRGFTEPERRRISEAVHAAKQCNEDLHPGLCVSYLRTWQDDRDVWSSYLDGLPRGLTPRQALTHLGLRPT